MNSVNFILCWLLTLLNCWLPMELSSFWYFGLRTCEAKCLGLLDQRFGVFFLWIPDESEVRPEGNWRHTHTQTWITWQWYYDNYLWLVLKTFGATWSATNLIVPVPDRMIPDDARWTCDSWRNAGPYLMVFWWYLLTWRWWRRDVMWCIDFIRHIVVAFRRINGNGCHPISNSVKFRSSRFLRAT